MQFSSLFILNSWLTIILLFSCKDQISHKIGIQPLQYEDTEIMDSISAALSRVYTDEISRLSDRTLPTSAMTTWKSTRYRADTLIAFLKHHKPRTLDYIIGITDKDISTTKTDPKGNILKPLYKYKDWGIFGLGYCPGPSCVISSYRVSGVTNQLLIKRLQKIAVHEIGHNHGLPHCTDKSCVMQDAAESIHTIDAVSLRLCSKCLDKIHG